MKALSALAAASALAALLSGCVVVDNDAARERMYQEAGYEQLQGNAAAVAHSQAVGAEEAKARDIEERAAAAKAREEAVRTKGTKL
jgi:hypothetical protein